MIDKNHFDERCIFVYTIGKTATSSIVAPVKEWANSQGVPYFDGHTLFNESVNKHQDGIWYEGVEIFRNALKENRLKNVKIISAIREPIGREYSSFFQNLHKFWNRPYEGERYPPEELWKANIRSKRGKWCLDWFDNEMLANFNIDVYSSPWPERGYDFFQSKKADLLLMRHDLDNELKGILIEDFIGAPRGSIKIENRNTSKDKWYNWLVEPIKQIPLPKEYCDFMLDSKYTDHFFSREKESLREKYQEKTFIMEHFYKNTEGEDWFNYSSLYSSMVNKFESGSRFVEVGVWKGRSACYMAVEIINSGKDIKFDCVDTFDWIEQSDIKQDKFTGLYETYLRNIEPVSNIINTVRKLSLDAAKDYADNSIDFIFIDAAHDYDNVKADIEAWLPKVKKGGIIAGHDWHAQGVKRAVRESFADNFSIETGCWIHSK